jgi:hypothetical protein
MDRSRFIAGLIGPTLFAVALSLFVNRQLLPDLMRLLATQPAAIFLAGITTLVIGLAIVLSHRERRGWRLIVTIFGWLAVVAGVLRIVIPYQIASWVPAITGQPWVFPFAATVFLILGLFLSWKAFRA